MTNQETFDFVVNHLYQQGKPAIDNLGNCLYRAPDGSKCAAGCLIPDEEYSLNMETHDIVAVQSKYQVCEEHDIKLVRHLQIVHDEYYSIRETWGIAWKDYLNDALPRVAERFTLQFSPRP